MFGAVIGALLGAVGLTALIDTIAGTDVTAWFFEKVGSVAMFFISPLLDLLFQLYDTLLSLVKGFFT